MSEAIIISKYRYTPMVTGINEDDESASLIAFHDVNYEESKHNEIVENIYFEAVVPARKDKFYHQRMIDFVNIL